MKPVEFRVYAAYGNCLTRTGHALKSMTKAVAKARRMSISHPFVELRILMSTGNEVLENTFVGGEPLVR